jgi:hypothetical protein
MMIIDYKKSKRFHEAVDVFHHAAGMEAALELVATTREVGHFFLGIDTKALLAELDGYKMLMDRALRNGEVDGAEAIRKCADRAAYQAAEKIVRTLEGEKSTPLETQLRASLKRVTPPNVVPLRKKENR